MNPTMSSLPAGGFIIMTHALSQPNSTGTGYSLAQGMNIGQFLIRRLMDYGVRDVFGIPGDYVLGFYSMMEHSELGVIGCCREDNAGFAADAYARLNGMAAVCVTYGVGGLSLCNSIAGAYAEKAPIVVISGSPGMSERTKNPLLHHKVRDFRTQLDVFDKICVATADLCDTTNAFKEIDRVLEAAVRFKRPVYIELPRDMVKVVPRGTYEYQAVVQPTSDSDALEEAVREAHRMISASTKPVILAGVELHRYGLQDELLAFAEGAKIPITSTLTGKSVIRETHPLYAGLYEGGMSPEEITRFVEDSDCLILLGTPMTDIDLGVYSANLDPNKCILATSEDLRICHHHYQDVLLGDFLRGLTDKRPRPAERPIPHRVLQPATTFQPERNKQISISRLIARLNQSLDERTIVISDVGDALFAATELVMHGRTEFIGPAYYTSMGYSVPAALGSGVAKPDMRTVVLVGDGAFQMTGNELSTIVRHRFDTIIILLDNKGYGTERFLHPGDFNEIHPWAYHKLTEVYGGGKGYEVRTEEEFDTALRDAWPSRGEVRLIQVHLSPEDGSPTLRRLAARLSKKV